MPAPRIIIIAGPNGAGKTTFAREFLPVEAGCGAFINADLIAAGLSPFAPERAAIQAGRLMLATMAQHVRRGESFAFETTLAGLGYARQIPVWRQSGYVVKLFFLSLPSAEMAIERVAQRVRSGGHDIPSSTIRRRWHAGRRLLERHTRTWSTTGSCTTKPARHPSCWIGARATHATRSGNPRQRGRSFPRRPMPISAGRWPPSDGQPSAHVKPPGARKPN